MHGALDRSAGEEMQQRFPEGFFFSRVLFSRASCRRCSHCRYPLRAQAIAEAWRADDRLDSPAALAPFSPALDPLFGVFVVGWGTWLRTGVLALEAPDRRAGTGSVRCRRL
ncbi:MAG: hypothetical protein NZ699_07025 [Roseiflexus sp.]|nr:hypothetical protein [Roseiflexus sp.]MCS7288869.1 hypothetical protein [Roseiflexus sp.]MDW8144839.1 hypothetical protein [Roseiflexaceae bacterium]